MLYPHCPRRSQETFLMTNTSPFLTGQSYSSSLLQSRLTQHSNVLATSLERSRQNWLSGQYLSRYWSKPTTKKDAASTAPNNPQKSWMKEVGPCTIIVEPLIFGVTLYVSKEPALTQTVTQPKKTAPSTPGPATPASTSSTTYTTPNVVPPRLTTAAAPSNLAHQVRPTTTPLPRPTPASSNIAPITTPATNTASQTSTTIQPAKPAASSQSAPNAQVVQLLATRAAANPELKALMQVVATNTATPDQLRAFKEHIDDMTRSIRNSNPAPETPTLTPSASQATSRSASPAITSNLNSPKPRPILAPSKMNPTPVPRPLAQSVPRKLAPPPPAYPAILEFHGPAVSTDRFLFPPYSILESLTPQSLLASFLVIQKGSLAQDPYHYDPGKTYYEPITIKIDVLPKDRQVLETIKRSVKPVDQVVTYMKEQIKTCHRADMRFLALRLPIKSQRTEEHDELHRLREESVVAKVKKDVSVPVSSGSKKNVSKEKEKDVKNKRASKLGMEKLSTPATPASERDVKVQGGDAAVKESAGKMSGEGPAELKTAKTTTNGDQTLDAKDDKVQPSEQPTGDSKEQSRDLSNEQEPHSATSEGRQSGRIRKRSSRINDL